MQLSLQVLPDLPDSVLWKLARCLPDHQTNDTAHRTFCLLGRSWRNAYCSSRHALTLHLGPSGLRGVASRVLACSGSSATRLEVHVDWRAQVQLPSLVAGLRSLPKLQQLTLYGLDTEGMVALAPALGALGELRELTLLRDDMRAADAGDALAHALQHLTSLQHLRLNCVRLAVAGVAALAAAIQQRTELLSLDLGYTYMQPKAMAVTIQHLTSLQKLVLSVNCLRAEDTAAMARALNKLARLQELDVREFHVGEGIGPLAPAIGGLTALRQLRFVGEDFYGRSADAEDMEALAHALAPRTGLQLLHLKLSLNTEVVDALVSALRQLTGLTELNLHNNNLGAGATAALAPALARLTDLVNLSISLVAINEQEPLAIAAAALAPALAVLTQLTHVHLRGKYFSAAADPGMAALASAVGDLVRLQHLEICGNDLGQNGERAAAALAAVIPRLTQLQVLCLGYNRLGPEGMAALAPALRRLTGLQHLHLQSNSLEAGGMEALAAVLPQMPGLLHLKLSGNCLGVAAAEVLALPLAHMPGLQHLDLCWNRLGVQGMVALAPALARMLGLQHLVLHSNTFLEDGPSVPTRMSAATSETMQPSAAEGTMDVEGVAALGPALAQLTGLRHLDFCSNDLGAQGVAALTPVLEQLPRLRHFSLDD